MEFNKDNIVSCFAKNAKELVGKKVFWAAEPWKLIVAVENDVSKYVFTITSYHETDGFVIHNDKSGDFQYIVTVYVIPDEYKNVVERSGIFEEMSKIQSQIAKDSKLINSYIQLVKDFEDERRFTKRKPSFEELSRYYETRHKIEIYAKLQRQRREDMATLKNKLVMLKVNT